MHQHIMNMEKVNIARAETSYTITTIATSNNQDESVPSNNNNYKVFFGVTNDDHFIEKVIAGNLFPQVVEMLIDAVNNRTIERDYFRLYNSLLSGEISEEEFDKEIDSNPDKYVLDGHIVPTREHVALAVELSQRIKEVSNSEDLASLFSFNSCAVDKILAIG